MSAKVPVRFEADFPAALTAALRGLPNGTVEAQIVPVEIDGEMFTVLVDEQLALQLMPLHQAYTSAQPLHNLFIPASGLHVVRLVFEPEDLEALFFTIDKILAGAEPVFLSGELKVFGPLHANRADLPERDG